LCGALTVRTWLYIPEWHDVTIFGLAKRQMLQRRLMHPRRQFLGINSRVHFALGLQRFFCSLRPNLQIFTESLSLFEVKLEIAQSKPTFHRHRSNLCFIFLYTLVLRILEERSRSSKQNPVHGPSRLLSIDPRDTNLARVAPHFPKSINLIKGTPVNCPTSRLEAPQGLKDRSDDLARR